jgi:hypothetical protein
MHINPVGSQVLVAPGFLDQAQVFSGPSLLRGKVMADDMGMDVLAVKPRRGAPGRPFFLLPFPDFVI